MLSWLVIFFRVGLPAGDWSACDSQCTPCDSEWTPCALRVTAWDPTCWGKA